MRLYTEITISNKEIVDLLVDGKSNDQILTVIKNKFNSDAKSERSLLRNIRMIKTKFIAKFTKCQRKWERFCEKNSGWLRGTFKLEAAQKLTKVGRPEKSFVNSGTKTKQRKVEGLKQEKSAEELIMAAAMSYRSNGLRDLAWLIEYVSKHPEKATLLKKFILAHPSEQNRLSSEEALGFLCKNDLSKNQYQNLRNVSRTRGADIFPAYNEVREAKEFCYPEGS